MSTQPADSGGPTGGDSTGLRLAPRSFADLSTFGAAPSIAEQSSALFFFLPPTRPPLQSHPLRVLLPLAPPHSIAEPSSAGPSAIAEPSSAGPSAIAEPSSAVLLFVWLTRPALQSHPLRFFFFYVWCPRRAILCGSFCYCRAILCGSFCHCRAILCVCFFLLTLSGFVLPTRPPLQSHPLRVLRPLAPPHSIAEPSSAGPSANAEPSSAVFFFAESQRFFFADAASIAEPSSAGPSTAGAAPLHCRAILCGSFCHCRAILCGSSTFGAAPLHCRAILCGFFYLGRGPCFCCLNSPSLSLSLSLSLFVFWRFDP